MHERPPTSPQEHTITFNSAVLQPSNPVQQAGTVHLLFAFASIGLMIWAGTIHFAAMLMVVLGFLGYIVNINQHIRRYEKHPLYQLTGELNAQITATHLTLTDAHRAFRAVHCGQPLSP